MGVGGGGRVQRKQQGSEVTYRATLKMVTQLDLCSAEGRSRASPAPALLAVGTGLQTPASVGRPTEHKRCIGQPLLGGACAGRAHAGAPSPR